MVTYHSLENIYLLAVLFIYVMLMRLSHVQAIVASFISIVAIATEVYCKNPKLVFCQN